MTFLVLLQTWKQEDFKSLESISLVFKKLTFLNFGALILQIAVNQASSKSCDGFSIASNPMMEVNSASHCANNISSADGGGVDVVTTEKLLLDWLEVWYPEAMINSGVDFAILDR